MAEPAKPMGVPGVPAPRPAALPNAGAMIHGRALSTYSPGSQAHYRGMIQQGTLTNSGGRLISPFNTALFNPLANVSGRDMFDMANALTNLSMQPTINSYQQQLHAAQNRQDAVSTRGMAYYTSLLGSIKDTSAQAGGPMGLDNIYRLKAAEAQDSIRRWGQTMQLPIQQNLSNFEATRADRFSTNLLNLRQQGLNSYITQGNLTTNQTRAQTGVTNATTNAANAKERKTNDWRMHLDRVAGQGITDRNGALAFQSKTGYTPREWANLPLAQRLAVAKAIRAGKPAKGAKPSTLTANEENSQFRYVDAAISWFRRAKAGGVAGSAMRQHLLFGGKSGKETVPKIPDWAINAAEDLVYRGGLSPAAVTGIKNQHLTIGRRYKLLGAGIPLTSATAPFAPGSVG